MLKKLASIRCSRKAMMVLILVAALTVSGTSTALAANGGNFILGSSNTATAITSLYANFNGQALVVQNPNTGSVATALRLIVPSSRPPMIVNSSTKVANLNADLLDGKDSSAFAPVSGFQAQEEMVSRLGPLPLQTTYTSKGGTLLITFSGTGYRGGGNAQFPGIIELQLWVDGLFDGLSDFYTNELNSHRTFPTQTAVLSRAAGQHTIELEAVYNSECNTSSEPGAFCTTTDDNDFFSVSVLEIPNATSAAAASKTAEPTATKASKKHHAARHHKKHKNKA